MRTMADEKLALLTLEIDSDAPNEIMGDPVRLSQIVCASVRRHTRT